MFSISKQVVGMGPLLRLWMLLSVQTRSADGSYTNGRFLDHWSEKNFLVVWNIQSQFCSTKHGVDIHLDVQKYGIVRNDDGGFYGDEVNIFYSMGKFPYIDNGVDIDGGIPQLGDLSAHEQQVAVDVQKIIPNSDFRGLGVIDWESWRPAWDTNWSPFSIYRDRSLELVINSSKTLNKTQVQAKAKEEFETSARNFMDVALATAKKLRPKAFWGYYGFPACYNYDQMQKSCSARIMKTNDDIMWLYNSSTVIFPSIYIGEGLTERENAVYVYGTLSESQRVAYRVRGRPILPYVMLMYRDTKQFLRQEDLFATIGQAAALGLPGVVLWAPYSLVSTPDGCKNLKNFVHTTLGPTIEKIRHVVHHKRSGPLDFPDDFPSEKWLDRIVDYFNHRRD